MSGLTVRFWGTRGSIPTPGRSTEQYGGNTTCVELRHGETVVALLGGDNVTLKRLYREKGHVRLQPANPYLEPLIVSDVAIQGKVVAVIRRYD